MILENSPPFTLPPATGHHAIYQAGAPDYVSIYVEGPHDVDLWANWFTWRPRHAGSRIQVIKQIEELEGSGYSCVGIIDSDFDRLEGTASGGPNIVATDGHDIECDILRSSVLERFLLSIGHHVVDADQVRRYLVENGIPFGALRWIFHRRRVKFNEGRLSPFTFADKKTGSIDLPYLQRTAATLLNCTVDDVQADVDLIMSRALANHSWSICNGHDLIDLLTIVLQGPLQCKKAFSRPEVVASHLRVSLGAEHLGELQIWKALGAWEERNSHKAIRRRFSKA